MKTLFGYTTYIINNYGEVTTIHDDEKPPTIPEGYWAHLPHDVTHRFHEATGWYRPGPTSSCFHPGSTYSVRYMDGRLSIGSAHMDLPLAEAIRVAKALVLGP